MITTSFVTGEYSNKRAMAIWTECEKTDRCALFANGKCACKRYILGRDLTCPNAERKYEQGPTKRAKSHCEWVKNHRKRLETNSREYDKKLSIVADYVFVPIPWMNPIIGNSVEGLVEDNFFRIEDFNEDTVQNIVKHRPRGFNGVIRAYEEEMIPKFVQQLREEIPDVYNRWATKYPNTEKLFREISPIGRTAYVSTLPDGKIANGYEKKGNLLINNGGRDVMFNGRFGTNKPVKITIEINEDMVVKITENIRTDENTRYVD